MESDRAKRRHPGFGSNAAQAGSSGPARGQSGGASLFRRPSGRRSRRSVGCLHHYCKARLESRPCVADGPPALRDSLSQVRFLLARENPLLVKEGILILFDFSFFVEILNLHAPPAVEARGGRNAFVGSTLLSTVIAKNGANISSHVILPL